MPCTRKGQDLAAIFLPLIFLKNERLESSFLRLFKPLLLQVWPVGVRLLLPRSVFNGSLTGSSIRLGGQRGTPGLEEDPAALPGSAPSAHSSTKRDFGEAGQSRASISRARHLAVIVGIYKRDLLDHTPCYSSLSA